MQKAVLTTLMACFLAGNIAIAQESNPKGVWYFGMGGGFHSNKMKYSNLDESLYPESKNQNGSVVSVFALYEFGKERHFAIRPEVAFLKRGGKLTEIGKALYGYPDELKDVYYRLKGNYWDIRVPVIYQFGKADNAWRPYVYVAPVLGFASGGRIQLEEQYTDGSYAGYAIDATKANLASTYFAGAVGLGVKYQFDVCGSTCFLGLEASYEYGFTDTYGGKEKDGEAIMNPDIFPDAAYQQISGTRKFSGFEAKITLGIPFSIFKKKAKPAPEPVAVVPVPVTPAPEPVEEKPCYTLDEINTMMAKGENVEGKTICAVNEILFDFGKSTIRPESDAYLDKLAQTLIRTNAHIEVKGHTDNVGTEAFNLKLSKERAQAVVEYLVTKGVSRSKLSYSYYGMSQPRTTNDTEEGRALNRRVEFEIMQ